MGHKAGEPIVGILHSTDASSGEAIPIFKVGSKTAHTLGDREYIEIHSIEVIVSAGGDGHVFIGADATPGTGETVVRGTVASNGRLQNDYIRHAGGVGEQAWLVAPAGAADVRFNGVIREEGDGTSVQPDWRANDFGQ